MCNSPDNGLPTVQSLLLAAALVLALFIWQGDKGLNLADEGFLWYGVQRVMLGEVPIRDFMAYDPGRYYWSAALMSLWQDNRIVTLRGTVAIFQAAGLFVGLYLIARAAKQQNVLYLLLSAVILAVWMFPRHKLFDISLSILLIGVLTHLAHNPTSKRYFVAGLCLGLVAVFGRNHGIYGVAGSAGIMLWLSIRHTERPGVVNGLAPWVAGVAAGVAPLVLMALLIPGFAGAFRDSISFLFERQATNLPLPIPWPWRLDLTAPPGVALRELLVSMFFLATIVFGVLSVAWVVWQRNRARRVSPALAAAAFLALPYAHHAYSRADVAHLAQGIFPLLVGCLVLLAAQPARIKWPLACMLCASSFWTMHVYHPGWQCYSGAQCVDIDVSGNRLRIDAGTASTVEMLRRLAGQFAPNGARFLVTPLWPGAYALLGRASPQWEIYAIHPRSSAFEQAEIERIKAARPGFALVIDLPLDGRDELRFSNTHPLTNRYIVDHFEHLPGLSNPAYRIYRWQRD